MFIDKYRDRYGVERICRTLNEHLAGGFITSRGYRLAKSRPVSRRARRDQELIPVLKRLHAENYSVYGVRKMWMLIRREGYQIGRDQVSRLMRLAGLCGVIRGRRPKLKLHRKPDAFMCPDLVQRQFQADRPGRLWVADITYVRVASGFCYTAFITDVFSRRIVGWAVKTTQNTEALPLEALQQALREARARSVDTTGLVHHSDRGSQYSAIVYTQALADSGLLVSRGSVGDSYDNALAETVNGLYKTELVYARKWAGVTGLEYATAGWVYWWNTRRLHTSLGYRTPVEVEAEYYSSQRVANLVP